MIKKTAKYLALVLALVMLFSVMTGCGNGTQSSGSASTPAGETTSTPATTEAPNDTLVVAESNFSEKFCPFFYTSAYDNHVVSLVHQSLLGYDRGGSMILKGIEGETVPYNGTDYTYYGIADCEVVQNDDGTVAYNFTLRDDVTFSDGEPMTIDDVIFSMYVLCDPTYDGSSTFYSLPIEGLAEYRSGMESKANLILAAGRDNAESEYFTAEEHAQYWEAIDKAGVDFVNSIFEYCKAYEAKTVGEAMGMWGYEVGAEADEATCFAALEEAYGGDLVAMNGVEAANVDLFEAVNGYLGDDASNFAIGVQTGEGADNISGIVKTGDYSMTINMTEFDATAILQFSLGVAPLHYYGEESLYNYDNNQFGFVKGDLSDVKSVTTTPVGAGPYKFVEYKDGIVYFEANESYWQGAPLTKYIRYQEFNQDSDKLTSVATGTCDIGDPSFSVTTVDAIKGYNSNGDLTGDTLTTVTVDNNGYGYIAMQAERVSVGGESGSDASKALRKGFATLFSVYRDTVVASYYGDRASVIQYPITNTSWAAPKPADEGYAIAYSTDVDGNPIYTDGMTESEKYAAALDAAIGFFKAAGYTWDEATSTFTAAPEGASLVYSLWIPGSGTGDHPAYGIVTAAKEALATIGITLDITDLSNSSELWDAIDAATLDMWVAAWGDSLDPDMTQVYSSANAIGHGGADSNKYCIMDPALDELIVAARSSADTNYRKGVYKECLDIILDWACEVPTYQRQNAFIFNTANVNIESLTPDMTTFWNWMNEAHTVQMN